MTGNPVSWWSDSGDPAASAEACSLEQFLTSEEQRAFRIVRYAVGNDEDALDIVQDSMLKLVSRYSQRPSAEWAPLFHRILQNGIRDHHRRQKTRRRWLWEGFRRHDDEDGSDVDNYADNAGIDLQKELELKRDFAALNTAIQALPLRQQQVFLLRCWEGLSTREASEAMGCSEGSVKTHYFRALSALRHALTEPSHEQRHEN